MARGETADPGAMDGKVVVMTGATSGIGEVAAVTLAERGARLVIVARDEARAARTLARLRTANPAARHMVHRADLSRLAEVRRVSADIAAAEPRIDVLANNAGALFGARVLTEDGLERTFATNHMAYLLLTLGLREPLMAAGGARVVNTSSAAHRGARLDPADIQLQRRYSGWRAYSLSKLYNILFTRELARRWADRGVTVNCFHPGFVATRFGDSAGRLAPLIAIAKMMAITPEKGADTLIHLATSPQVEGVSGRYFYKSRPVRPRPPGEDDTAAAALWAESLRLAGPSA